MVLIYTIGYGNREFEAFVSLLKKHNIDTIIDVRRFPKSKCPEYTRESLEIELPKFGIKYVFMGSLLGGFRRGYEKYMKSNACLKGIKKVIDLAKDKEASIVCLKRNPKGCHRRYVSCTLKELGLEVVHIISK